MSNKKHQHNEAHEDNGAEVEAAAPALTQQIVVQGVAFEAPAPYAEGHVLSASEAVVLNQTYAENLRNNFSARIKKAKTEHGETLPDHVLQTLADEFSKYAAEYEFHGKRASRAPVDPVAKEAHKIAKALVMEALRKRNIDTKTLPEGKMDELITGVLSKNPDIRVEAERRITATKAVAADALEGLV